MNVLWHALMGGVIAILAAAFALRFRDEAGSRLAVGRIRERRAQFRVGGFSVVGGVVVVSVADAILYAAGLPLHEAGYVTLVVGGFAVVAVGVAVLDLVLWLPERVWPPAADARDAAGAR